MMRKLFIFLAIVMVCALGVKAAAPVDSLRLRVNVEISLNDGTKVIKSIDTKIADPGRDISVQQLMDLAARTLAPQYQTTVVREVRVIEAVPAPDVAEDSLIVAQETAIEEAEQPADVAIMAQPVVTNEISAPDTVTGKVLTADSVFSHRQRNWKPVAADAVRRVRFAWGAEIASSVDLSGHDMTSVDLNLSLGLTYRWLIFAGLGAGADLMVSNSCRTYPVYLNFRTDFSRKVLPIFLDLRGGVAFNCLPDEINQQAPYASLSLGFNLATGRTFRSYILCGYTFNGRSDVNTEAGLMRFPSLSLASIRLGVQF